MSQKASFIPWPVNRRPGCSGWCFSHDGSGQGRGSDSLTHDHARIIPGISEELEPQSLKRSR